MQRVAIVGPCGAGKSTLARKLGEITGLPVYHMDRLYWLPGWVEERRKRFDKKLRKVVETEQWIIDGNYSRTFHIRLPRADTVIYLDFPRHIYFRRVIWRIIKGYGRTRSDVSEGCVERFDPEFLKLVWNIPKKSRPGILSALQEYNGTFSLYTLSTPREVREFLQKLKTT